MNAIIEQFLIETLNENLMDLFKSEKRNMVKHVVLPMKNYLPDIK